MTALLGDFLSIFLDVSSMSPECQYIVGVLFLLVFFHFLSSLVSK